MTKKIAHIGAVAISLLALTPPPISAGGLLGDISLFRSDIGSRLDAESLRTLQDVETKQATPTFDPEDMWSKPIPIAPTTSETKTYDQLKMQKSTEQRASEAAASRQLDVEIDNICLTASGACSVHYTTKGSTCFCSAKGTIELGIIQ